MVNETCVEDGGEGGICYRHLRRPAMQAFCVNPLRDVSAPADPGSAAHPLVQIPLPVMNSASGWIAVDGPVEVGGEGGI